MTDYINEPITQDAAAGAYQIMSYLFLNEEIGILQYHEWVNQIMSEIS